MDRRSFFRSATAATGAAAAFALLPDSLREALAAPAPTGGLDIIEHVVILMQENRSFDHYYGTMRGVRGFRDPAAISLPGGQPVYRQPNGTGYVLPYPVDDQFMQGTPHGWGDGHNAWNKGRHDQWVPNKGVRTMTTHLRSALPFYYQLADAFTICDAYHCSEMGPTNPNRFFLFSGMIGYEPGTTKRAIGNDSWQNPGHTGYTWKSYAERLEAAGRSWRVYQEWDNYGDNSLDYFASMLAVGKKALAYTGQSKLEYFYYALAKASKPDQDALLAKLDQGLATLTPAERSLYDRALHRVRPDQTVPAFAADVTAGRLPAVSWIVAPEKKSEHPDWGPNQGAEFTKGILDAIASKPDVWNKTVVFITYDENDGFFDHVPNPAPPLSSSDGQSTVATTDEIYLDAPIGLGTRVPMLVVSPWSRGGNVCSEVFDHTSVLRFLEKWSGVAEPQITPWRRAVCGDLTGALDTTTSNVSYPALPTPVPTGGPMSTNPQPPAVQALPTQESGVKPARPLPYDLAVHGRVASDKFWLDFTNHGTTTAAHFYVHAANFRTDGPWRYTVEAGKSLSDYWQAGTPTGAYDLIVTGPNGFIRRFTGNRSTATTTGNANPEVTLRHAPAENKVYLKMTNAGQKACTLTITPNNRAGGPWTYQLQPGQSTEDYFTTGGTSGWYDLTATATGTADAFLRRFAGHMENGTPSLTDPVMGSGKLAIANVTADSEETTSENGRATNATDGTTSTIWHTKWSTGGTPPGPAPLPHDIRMDLGAQKTVTAIQYTPRQDGSPNGRIGEYEIALSQDGTTWTTAATGTFTDDATVKTARTWPTTARYVRLRALTEAGARGPWTSAAEISALGW
ncbi:non-hemolytic phospholipase C [Actinorhabdospora filicis]|uniref:phospholipase C n=1 Tax=Actinorhabdospora filicis TaxID=1785913 RepID=A0A9W6SQ27_9ACTN|nr:phospholipase C, phosphocholine-specific [Actinorhabdospora filicis]GLZ79929.1 non-hemolytic phospholipase C [Actinorhabdospora filicis]